MKGNQVTAPTTEIHHWHHVVLINGQTLEEDFRFRIDSKVLYVGVHPLMWHFQPAYNQRRPDGS